MKTLLNCLTILFVVSIFTISACSTSENMLDNESNTEAGSVSSDDNIASENSELMELSLSDSYGANGNSIPENFKQIKQTREVERDLTRGFRVQIYSGEDVSLADSIASTFRAWSDTTIVGYQAETYTFFKAPQYRVHIGDFHEKERALSYSKLVKRLFKDAWVVYDTVEPFHVPADTVRISFVD